MDDRLPDVMTIEEVASFLRIPLSSVYRLAQEGRIPAQKVGRHWRFYRLTLTKWIARDAGAEPPNFGSIPRGQEGRHERRE